MSGLDVSDYTIPCGASTSCRHQICQHCGEPMRIGNSRATDHPGTVGHHARGLCNACYLNPDRILKLAYPKPCDNCDVLMRPDSAPPEKYPTAEAAHGGYGLCKACYMHQRMTKAPAGFAQLKRENNIAGLNRFMQRIKGKSRSRV